MESGEESTPAKRTKPAAAETQELPTTPSYPDWATPMQAYYGAGAATPPFFTSAVSSPTPHPYMWGGQHLMPPYGTPLPYHTMYPPGGIYGHPSMAASQGTVMTPSETEGREANGKGRVSMKKSKGSSGNMGLVSGKSGDGGKTAGGISNDGSSECGDSGSEGSSDTSDEDTNQQEFSASRKRSFDQMLADGANAQNNNSMQYSGPAVSDPPASVPGKPSVTGPTTNLNIGMDLWNTSKTRRNAPGVSPAVVPASMVGHEGVLSEHLWIHDERELKRQRRKQSNRESARRSRLRKQAECEQLAVKVDTLRSENQALRDELQRLAEECEKLTSENTSIREQLTQLYGHDVISTFEVNDTNTPVFQPVDGEGISHAHTHDTSRGSNSGSSQKNANGKLSSSNGKV